MAGKRRRHMLRTGAGAAILAAALAVGPMISGPSPLSSPAESQPAPSRLPAPPADGVMGFVVESFVQPIVEGKDACPQGPALKLREAYIATLAPAERERLLRKENELELQRLWQATAFGPKGTNICSQPEMFSPPLQWTVDHALAYGLDLDGDASGSGGAQGCAHKNFTGPDGTQGIDNQEYRALGCTLEWRNEEGLKSDISRGSQQFHTSGEWTQVILLRGVDSLVRDDDVEVIYANTPDRPTVDSKGNFLRGMTFGIGDKPPRERNVLKGKIVDGVLTTQPADIKLTQTWGQGGARDIRGNRTRWRYLQGRLRLAFQPDGSLKGVMGGYRPLFDAIASPAIGGAGSALAAGIDCASQLATLKKNADGIRDPKTGECTAISSAQTITAVPAFVNDVPRPRTAAR